jgi:hypothetical protein
MRNYLLLGMKVRVVRRKWSWPINIAIKRNMIKFSIKLKFNLSNLHTMTDAWRSADQIHLKVLVKVIKSAVRLVLNKSWSDSVSQDMCEVLYWLMPSSLQKKAHLTLMYKLVHNPYAPDYFLENIKTNSKIHRYGTRSASNLYVPVQPRYSAANKMFFFRAINLRNYTSLSSMNRRHYELHNMNCRPMNMILWTVGQRE